MHRGYIKVWRKLQEDEIWMNPEPFNKRDAWIDLLVMTWAKKKIFIIGNKAVELEPGQLFLAYRFLCSKWHWSKGKLKDYLDLLASPDVKKIIYKSTHDGTLITILNWETYQPIFDVDRTPIDTPTGRKPDVNRTQTGQNKECKRMLKKVKEKRFPPSAHPKIESETPKQKQDRRIETIIEFVKKNWDEDFTPSQIQVLVYGQKREKGKVGFKTHETLWEFLKSNIGIKPQEGLYSYLRRCSMDEKTVYVHADKAWKNKDPKLIGEILKDMAKESEPTK